MFKKLYRLLMLILGVIFIMGSGLQAEESQMLTDEHLN